jgi:hypothetical protein
VSLNAHERETVINASDGDDLVRILTHQLRFLGRLRKDERFTEIRSGYEGTTEWAEFTIPASLWNPITGAKRRLSADARTALIERLSGHAQGYTAREEGQ